VLDNLIQRVERVIGGLESHPAKTDDNWLMIVRERYLLFASWPIPVTQLRPVIPSALEIDTFQGAAWVTVETLQISTARIRNLPLAPSLEGTEVNVRTYVQYKGERGIHFLSLDSPGLLMDELSKHLFKLPFHNAEASVELNGDNYHVESIRLEDQSPPASFACSARLTGGPAMVVANSLEGWLLNQTCLFAVDSNGDVYRGYVGHRPHSIQPVEGVIETNTLVSAAGITLPGTPPVLTYSPGDDSMSWPITKI
jgi:uncharacterized protein YqjF (DUF2071 family)